MSNHFKVFMGLALATAPMLLSSCSPSKFAIESVMVPVLDNARAAALASNDIEMFRDGAPGNIFLAEGLVRTDPENGSLRINISLLYFSYAFAFLEDENEDRAGRLYENGFRHGLAALQLNRKFVSDWDVSFKEFEKSLKHLKKEDVPAAMWTAANRAQFISIHLDSTAVLRDIAKVTSLLERAAELDPEYFNGLVHIMIGSLHAFRPPMMGGDPEKSLANFETAFAIGGEGFLLARYFYARFYCYRVQDGEAFTRALESVASAAIADVDPYRLLNLIAKQKSAILLGDFDDLF